VNPKDDAARAAGKPSLRCMPWPPLFEIAAVLQHGANSSAIPLGVDVSGDQLVSAFFRASINFANPASNALSFFQ